MRRLRPVLAVLCALTAWPACAQPLPAAPPQAAGSAPPVARAGLPPGVTPEQARALMRLQGYLAPGQVPDSYRILPPAPKGTSPAREEDVAAYRETRRLQGSARWALAASDAVLTPFTFLDAESCATGLRLDASDAPALVRLLTRTGRDASQIVNRAKDQFKQLRPFVAEGGPICTEAERAGVAKSYAYPSGHSTYSWAAGLILAELMPDRATPILARARAYGESRVVCGVHWVSDVEEGRTNASILLAVLHADPQFQADLAAARLEVAAAESQHPSPTDPGPTDPAAAQCPAGAEAAAHTPWTR